MSNEDGAIRYLQYAEEFQDQMAPGPIGPRGPSVPGTIVLSSSTQTFQVTPGREKTLGSYTFVPEELDITDLVQLDLWVSANWTTLLNVNFYWEDLLIATAINDGNTQTHQVLTIVQVAGQQIHYSLVGNNDVDSGYVTIHETMVDGGIISVKADASALVGNNSTVNISRIADL